MQVKVGSGINGLLPTLRWVPSIYSVPLFDLPLLCAQKGCRILRLVPFRSYLAKRNATQKSCIGSIGLG